MAEQVRLHLEARLPELEDLTKRGIFTKARIRDIVLQRTKYEYRLKRRGAILEDFLAYINFEKQLEMERRDRVRELSIKFQHSLSDYSILQHVYDLYQRALVKFKGDSSLWIQFLGYASMQGNRKVFTRNISKALQFHPHSVNLWMMAAKFEWSCNGNMTSARTLLQQALRVTSNDIEIFHGFFELEIDFAIKLKERRTLLGIEDKAESPQTSEIQIQDVLGGTIAAAIFDNALETVPDISPAYASKFITTVKGVAKELPELELHVSESLISLFSKSPQHLQSLANSFISENCALETLRDAMNLLDRASSSNFSSGMLEVCVEFLIKIYQLPGVESCKVLSKAIHDKIDQLFQLAEERKILTAKLYSQWISLAPFLEYNQDMQKELFAKARGQYPEEELITTTILRSQIHNTNDCLHLKKISLLVAKISNLEERKDLTDELLFRWCSLAKDVDPKSATAVLEHIVSIPALPLTYAFAETLLLCREIAGLEKVRRICCKVRDKRIVNICFYEAWLAVEIMNSPADSNAIRTLFQKAILQDGKKGAIWKEFISFERSQRCFSEASRLHDQAIRSLPPSEIHHLQ